MRAALAVLLLAVSLASSAIAVEPDEMLKDPAQEARAEAIGRQLRCPVCKTESIEESDADFTKAYHDMNTETAMQRADQLAQRYRVAGVPTFVINGKYVTDVGQADPAGRDPNRLIALINDLSAQEHKH